MRVAVGGQQIQIIFKWIKQVSEYAAGKQQTQAHIFSLQEAQTS